MFHSMKETYISQGGEKKSSLFFIGPPTNSAWLASGCDEGGERGRK